MALTVFAPNGRKWAVRQVWLPFGPSAPPPAGDDATAALADDRRPGWLRRHLRAAVAFALGLASGIPVLGLARAEGAGTQDALVAAVFVGAIVGTSPYWIEDLLGVILFRLAVYTAVVWVPALALALALFYVFRIVGDRPWTVEAVSSDPTWAAMRWQVRGWRRSRGVAREIAAALERGEERPAPAGADGVPETITAVVPDAALVA